MDTRNSNADPADAAKRALQLRHIRQSGLANIAAPFCLIPLVFVKGDLNNPIVTISALSCVGVLVWSYRRFIGAVDFFKTRGTNFNAVMPELPGFSLYATARRVYFFISIWAVFFPDSLNRSIDVSSSAKQWMIRASAVCAPALALSSGALWALTKPVREARAAGDAYAQLDPKVAPFAAVLLAVVIVSLVMGLLCLVRLSTILEAQKKEKKT